MRTIERGYFAMVVFSVVRFGREWRRKHATARVKISEKFVEGF
jgi:hypothetical protein